MRWSPCTCPSMRRSRPRALAFASSLITPIPPGGSLLRTGSGVNRASAAKAKGAGLDRDADGRVGRGLAVEVDGQGRRRPYREGPSRNRDDPGMTEVAAAVDAREPPEQLR